MAKQNSPLIRVDVKMFEELKRIKEQMKKDLGVTISSAQASKIFVHERQLKTRGRLKF